MIGHDWGSFIAARFALWHPERPLAVVLQVSYRKQLSVTYNLPDWASRIVHPFLDDPNPGPWR